MATKVAIIGAGQVGTSIALALNHQLYPGGITIRMSDVNAKAPDLVKARFHDLNMPHANISFHESASAAAQDSDIVILATPLSVMSTVVNDIKSVMQPDAILTDTGSAKEKAITNIRRAIAGSGISYIPAHPGNGSQGSGPMTGHYNNILGPNSWMFLIEEPSYRAKLKPAFAKLRDFWDMAGVQVATADTRTHDRFFGICSHLQHAIAFSLLNAAHKDQGGLEIMKKSGTAFRNLTRVAISKLEDDKPSALVAMWTPILQQNKRQVLHAANNFLKHFDRLVMMVHDHNPTAIYTALGAARTLRANIKDPEKRESDRGEVADIREGLRDWARSVSIIKGHNLSREFGLNIEADFYANLLLPAAIAYSQTMNAKDNVPDLAREKANPSFRDGTAPALYSPEHMTQLLLQHRETFLERAASFRQSLCEMLENIRLGKDVSLSEGILSAQKTRNELPGPRKNADTRDAFLINDRV